ncbi:MAG: MoxR family ATPase [Gammaproteobacteria bacterium]|nr:MoxR family ATPase [Gammaproteobacteria bacterium]
MGFPYYSHKRKTRCEQPMQLPLSQYATQTDPRGYLPDPALADAVNVALMLGQPLLLTGEPGAGKTQLAYHAAWQLGFPQPLKFETKSTVTARDLFYFYNHLAHFHAAQSRDSKQKDNIAYLTYNALGLAILLANRREEVSQFLPPDFDAELRRHFPETECWPSFDWNEPKRCVVLIDEIDKAPQDFPNDILNEVEAMYFRIPELDNRRICAEPKLKPVLILTSNSEKHLPDAFLRRCIYYNIPFPEQKRLEEIISTRLGGFDDNDPFLSDALKLFFRLRDPAEGLRKRPSTAELLNWLSSLRGMYPDSANPLSEPAAVSRTLGCLIKSQEDQETAERIITST